ncbi:outer dense fiber protein 3-like [Frankliniella occidentalis]|uniref:Outer dense fiber protein 3-like n=1 Tax=Frankliniella occidentalis TaxID=133901 RepID=A0A6J1SNE4_FRAOC|nr:outer dense fiber protein 3-like [Frankliniella occidentalis]
METGSLSEKSLTLPYNCFAKKKDLYQQNPWIASRKRMPVVAEYPTPGPNAMPMPSYLGTQVMNSSITHRPAWSLYPRTEQRKAYYPAGPASYNTRNLKSQGGKASAPAYTMRIKPGIRSLQELPGPASYKVKARRILPKAPAFSFRIKPVPSSSSQTPGPNEYSLPTILGHHKTPPAHVLGYRLYDKDTFVTPGPGAYAHDNFSRVLQHAPEFSIREKLTEKTDKGTPGPGAYCHEKVIQHLPMAPRSTFGIKHSPFTGVWNPRIVGPRHC